MFLLLAFRILCCSPFFCSLSRFFSRCSFCFPRSLWVSAVSLPGGWHARDCARRYPTLEVRRHLQYLFHRSGLWPGRPGRAASSPCVATGRSPEGPCPELPTPARRKLSLESPCCRLSRISCTERKAMQMAPRPVRTDGAHLSTMPMKSKA